MLQAWGRVAGKLPSGKGPWGAGQQTAEHEPAVCPGGQEVQRHPGFYQEQCGQQEQGGDRAPVPQVLCLVLGPSLQEAHWVAGVCPEKGNKTGAGSVEQVLQGVAEGAGAV